MNAAAYIHSQSFFDHDRWAAHDKVGELLARGVRQIALALEGDAYTVSWPEREPAPVIPPAPEEGIAA
jgi:hypothetical protein